MLLDNSVALVSGVGPNIGREIARTLAENGAKVVCMDVNSDAAEQTARMLTDSGYQATSVQADITDPAAVQRAVDSAVSVYGGINILVNDAAISDNAGILDAEVDTWRKVIDVILTGTFLCTQAVARQMVAQGNGGVIINMASTSGHKGKAGSVAYQTAKAGILNFTRAAAVDLAPHGIRVNSVTPTQTGTPVGGGVARSDSEIPKGIPRGRWGRPSDQAQAVLFLVSQNADFITGVDLPVDGGNLAMRVSG
jgi:NAD(P)-dependent dehydrogenase (short-subunit alcohol dehydrogenase family)